MREPQFVLRGPLAGGAGRTLVSSGHALAVREFGDPAATPILALHGFPENGATWRPLAERLDGYRIVAPDQRGHGLSDAPRPISAYRLEELVDDALAMIEMVGEEVRRPVDVVGHDWGGAITWLLAERYPDRLRTATIIAAPHPYELRSALRCDRDQRTRSRYVLQAQVPWLPEWYVSRDGHRRLAAMFARGTHTPAELDEYCACWARPGVTRGMINWYRALVQRRPDDRRRVWRPSMPSVLVVTGGDDPLFSPALMRASLDRLPESEAVELDGVGHSPHRMAPDRVADLLGAHLAAAG